MGWVLVFAGLLVGTSAGANPTGWAVDKEIEMLRVQAKLFQNFREFFRNNEGTLEVSDGAKFTFNESGICEKGFAVTDGHWSNCGKAQFHDYAAQLAPAQQADGKLVIQLRTYDRIWDPAIEPPMGVDEKDGANLILSHGPAALPKPYDKTVGKERRYHLHLAPLATPRPAEANAVVDTEVRRLTDRAARLAKVRDFMVTHDAVVKVGAKTFALHPHMIRGDKLAVAYQVVGFPQGPTYVSEILRGEQELGIAFAFKLEFEESATSVSKVIFHSYERLSTPQGPSRAYHEEQAEVAVPVAASGVTVSRGKELPFTFSVTPRK